MEAYLAELFVFPMFIVFARVGAAVMVFPAISNNAVNMRTRLLLALVMSMAIYPVVLDYLPPMPDETLVMLGILLTELGIGIMFSLGARLMMASLNVAGEVIAFTSGFQAATLFDPVTGSNTAAPGLFLLMLGGVLIFAFNLHHLLVQGVVESYRVFPPGGLPPIGDALQAAVGTIMKAYEVGIKIAAPVMAMGFLAYMGFGIFNRLIPQVQAFFVAIPIALALGMFMLGVSLVAMLTLFGDAMFEYAILLNYNG